MPAYPDAFTLIDQAASDQIVNQMARWFPPAVINPIGSSNRSIADLLICTPDGKLHINPKVMERAKQRASLLKRSTFLDAPASTPSTCRGCPLSMTGPTLVEDQSGITLLTDIFVKVFRKVALASALNNLRSVSRPLEVTLPVLNV